MVNTKLWLSLCQGESVHRLLPEISIVVILVFVLGFNAYKTLTKARARWKAETKAMKEAASKTRTAVEVATADPQPAFAESTFAAAGFAAAGEEAEGDAQCEAQCEVKGGAKEAPDCGGPSASSERLAEVLAIESQQFPLWAWASLLGMTLFLIVYFHHERHNRLRL